MRPVAAYLLLLAAAWAAAPPPVQAALKGLDDEAAVAPHGWSLSSHVCPPPVAPGVIETSPRTCIFRNLYLWRGRAYFLTEGTPPALDHMGLDFRAERKKLAPRQPPDFVSFATPARFAQMVASTGSDSSGSSSRSGSSGGSSSSSSGGSAIGGVSSKHGGGTVASGRLPPLGRIPLAYMWRLPMVKPDEESGATCDGVSTAPGVNNYYHFLAENVAMLSMTLCEQFGHCDQYALRSRLQIVDVRPGDAFPCHRHENYPPYFRDALACFTDKPLLHINGSTLAGGGSPPVLVETAWMGLGPRCRGVVGGCYKTDSPRLPPTPAQMAAWRDTLGQCFKVPTATPVPLSPVRVLLVDRLYESGRSITNVGTLLLALRRRYSPQQVQVQLEYMEGLSIQQQARLFSQATVVVHMHGATVGNYAFLQKGAVVLQLAPVPRSWSPFFSEQLVRELANVSGIEVQHWINTDRTRMHINHERIAAMAQNVPVVAELLSNKTLYSHFLATRECPEGLVKQIQTICEYRLLKALTASFPPEEFVSRVDAAIARVFEKQGSHWEPLPAPQAAAAAAAPAGAAAAAAATTADSFSRISSIAIEVDVRSSSSVAEKAAAAAAAEAQPEDGSRPPEWSQHWLLPHPTRQPLLAIFAAAACVCIWVAVCRPMRVGMRKS